MQFKVPQDVLRPDRIVGFLTLRQLIIVIIGAGIDYSLYLVLNKQYGLEIWLPPIAFIGLITAAFAFVKFHDIVFEKLILVFIEYKFQPQARIWQKMRGDVVLSVLHPPLQKRHGVSTVVSDGLSMDERKKKMEQISKVVDAHRPHIK